MGNFFFVELPTLDDLIWIYFAPHFNNHTTLGLTRLVPSSTSNTYYCNNRIIINPSPIIFLTPPPICHAIATINDHNM